MSQRPALVTIVGHQGSAPRGVGACMLVTESDIQGSVGGGVLEHMAIQRARRMLRDSEASQLMSFPLGPESQQCCGGVVVLLFETLEPGQWLEALDSDAQGNGLCLLTDACGDQTQAWMRRTDGPLLADPLANWFDQQHVNNAALIQADGNDYLCRFLHRPVTTVSVFGAGHVGRALVAALAPLPFRILWIDSRADEFPSPPPPGVDQRVHDLPEALVAALPANSLVVVMTHRHPQDYAICRAALRRGDLGYVGLIGSQTKRRRFTREMMREGLSEQVVEALVCPIGLPGIPSKQPSVIAASVAAQLLQLDSGSVAARRQGIGEKEAARSSMAGSF